MKQKKNVRIKYVCAHTDAHTDSVKFQDTNNVEKM